MSSDITISKQDLRCVCDAIIETWKNFEYDPNGPDYCECIFCYNNDIGLEENEHIKHDLDCPVLVAMDIKPKKESNQSLSILKTNNDLTYNIKI